MWRKTGRDRWIVWDGALGAEIAGDPSLRDHEDVLQEIWTEDVYHMHSVGDLNGRLVIDIGAHIGAFTIRAALAGARVLAIEPWPEAVEFLRRNVKLNGLDEIVTIVEGAVVPTAQRGTIMMSRIGESGMGEVVENGQGVRGLAVGDVLAAARRIMNRVPGDEISVALLKLDIEGGEYPLFADAEVSELLARSAKIAMETHPGPIGTVIERLLATHHVEAFGAPGVGGMIHASRY